MFVNSLSRYIHGENILSRTLDTRVIVTEKHTFYSAERLPCKHARGPFINSSLPWQNGFPFADDIFKRIFMNETFYILIRISSRFVP